MVADRPGRCFRRMDGMAYTRAARRVMKKAFIKGVRNPKLYHYEHGVKKAYNYRVDMKSLSSLQVRDGALEAMRVAMNKELVDSLGPSGYFMIIRTVAHHILREHTIVCGAGADRVSQGMRNSFGKPRGKAARILRGKTVVSIFIDNVKNVPAVRKAFKKSQTKLPFAIEAEIVKFTEPSMSMRKTDNETVIIA